MGVHDGTWLADPSDSSARAGVPVFSDKFKITRLSCEIPSHVDQGIIGLMDPAHGPFVHQSWYWRSRAQHSRKGKTLRAHSEWLPHEPAPASSNSAPYKLLRYFSGEATTTMIDFVLPNMRLEEIRSGHLWFSSRATVTPVRRDLVPHRFRGGVESGALDAGSGADISSVREDDS